MCRLHPVRWKGGPGELLVFDTQTGESQRLIAGDFNEGNAVSWRLKQTDAD